MAGFSGRTGVYYFCIEKGIKQIITSQKRERKGSSPSFQKGTKRASPSFLTAQYKPLREKLDQMLNEKNCVEFAKHQERMKKQEKKKGQQVLE